MIPLCAQPSLREVRYMRAELEDLQEKFGALEYRLNRMEKDMKGLYLFINAYIERVEEDEKVMSEVKPMLQEVSATLKQLVRGMA